MVVVVSSQILVLPQWPYIGKSMRIYGSCDLIDLLLDKSSVSMIKKVLVKKGSSLLSSRIMFLF